MSGAAAAEAPAGERSGADPSADAGPGRAGPVPLNGHRRGWLVSGLMSLLGAGVAAYLVLAHLDPGVLVCGAGDCQAVQASAYATIGGVPIALLGLGAFLSLLGLGGWRWADPARAAPATLLSFGVALAGTLYAGYLFWLEVTVIGAICQWCVVAALCLLTVCLVEGRAAWRALDGA